MALCHCTNELKPALIAGKKTHISQVLMFRKHLNVYEYIVKTIIRLGSMGPLRSLEAIGFSASELCISYIKYEKISLAFP